MCFIISWKRPLALRAKQDIVCYKMVDRRSETTCESPIYKKMWTFGTLEKEKIKKKNLFIYPTIEEGLHSYSIIEMAIKSAWGDSIIEMAIKSAWGGPPIVECIIPKGTKYYYNPKYKEYVSEGLIIIGYTY